MSVRSIVPLDASLGRDYYHSLPDLPYRVANECGHSFAYIMQNYDEQPPFCGLCFFRQGWETELPTQLHFHHTLAENGNPQSLPNFLSHLFLVMGLKLPPKNKDGTDGNLGEFRRNRNSLAREQYTRLPLALAPKKPRLPFSQFPVTCALWKLMGYQPPLAIVLVKAIGGRDEAAIAREIDTSLMNVTIRMAKAVRTAMGYIPHEIREHREEGGDSSTGSEGDVGPGSEQYGTN